MQLGSAEIDLLTGVPPLEHRAYAKRISHEHCLHNLTWV